MSSPDEPQQPPHQFPRYPEQYAPPQPPEQPTYQQQPAYQQQLPYQPYQQDAYHQGYQQPHPGYSQPPWPGQPGQPGEPPPRRPGVLIAAGVLWLLNGAFMLLFGIVAAIADQLPGFDEAMREQDLEIDTGLLRTFGITSAVFGLAIVGLAIVVFSGATWARVAVMVVAVVPTALLVATVLFPLITLIASTLQFLPSVRRYVQARAQRTAVP